MKDNVLRLAWSEDMIAKFELPMLKSEAREMLLSLAEISVEYLWVIQEGDGCGGNRFWVTNSKPVLGDFEYIIWEGDLSKAFKDCNKVFESEYHLTEHRWSYYTLAELISYFFIYEEN